MIGADGKQSDLGMETAADFVEAVEIGSVTGMVKGMRAGFEDKSTVAAVHVANDASAPRARGGVSDFNRTELDRLPPIHFDNALHAEVRDQVADVAWHDDGGPLAILTGVRACDSPQRRAVEVVEMSVGNQDEVDARKIGDTDARAAETF